MNYLNNGDLNTELLYLGTPIEAKIIAKYNLIEAYHKEIPRIINWYKLTEAGKKFFSNYVTKSRLDDETNIAMFQGIYVKKFDFELLEK